MNSSSFIYFYLHIANQKTLLGLTLNDGVFLKFTSQPLYAKQSLTLLSLKGLKKKSDLLKGAAFAKQTLSYPEMSLPFFSRPQLYHLNLKYKALIRFQNLNFSKKKSTADQKAYFLSTKKTGPLVYTREFASLPFGKGKNFFSIASKSKDPLAALVPFSLQPNLKLRQQSLPFCFAGKPPLKVKTKMLSKIKTKKKLISTLYQKILSQSFKRNFIDHLKKIESLTKIKTYEKFKLLNSVNCVSKNLDCEKSNCGQPLDHKATTLQSRWWLEQPKLHFVWSAVAAKSGQSRLSHQMELFSWTPTLDKSSTYSKLSKAATAVQANIKTKKISTSLVDDKNINPPFENYMMLSNLTLSNSVQKKELKTFFDSLQLEAVKIKQDLSTKYKCASWLLEYIRAELGFRNANLRRVLNNLFLHTRQPICNLTPGKQAVPFALPFQKSSEKANQVFANSKNSLFVVPDMIKGLRVTFSGRLGGKKGMAKTLTKTTGRVPLSTLKEKVDFAKGVVHTKNGSLGVKVWICFN